MQKLLNLFLLLLSFFLAFISTTECSSSFLKTYIVHVVDPTTNSTDPSSLLLIRSSSQVDVEHREEWYKSFLPDHSRLVYSYHDVASGFAARLTEQELSDISTRPGFLHAYPDQIVPLHTTHTPQFLSLITSSSAASGLWNDSNLGRGIIIGVLDSGISPTHPSFRDDGSIPPPPRCWRGGCGFSPNLCNNKLIGARNFVRGISVMQPYDTDGHGTHVAATAAGIFVDNANIEGQAYGTAAGMAPYAHLSIYKVCSEKVCAISDILAGMDRAIYDGVHVMSVAIGGPSEPYYQNSIAIGALSAVARGIFVSCSGGNSGPSYSSLSNEAPWILTIGASTVDRSIRSDVLLGNGIQFEGQSTHQPQAYDSLSLPLVYPGGSRGSYSAAVCAPGSLSRSQVAGKIVVCDLGLLPAVDKGRVVKNAGGAGMIIANVASSGYTTYSEPHVLPASHVSYAAGSKIKSYISSTWKPTASIHMNGTVISQLFVLAPVVASFSSRGPSQADRNILKPDIIGPGVNILAAWPFKVGTPASRFNMISGTSMAASHLSGIAALLKSTHPDWSPAAIKSAMMTTAYLTANNNKRITDQNLKQADLFATGAGHVDPNVANNPGLVYDLNVMDYIPYLCGLGYTDRQVSAVVGITVSCACYKPVSGTQLNYPSFMVSVWDGQSVTVTRTVTNVGAAQSTYSVVVSEPAGAAVSVYPETISFTNVNEKATFSVTFTGKGSGSGGVEYSEGSLSWVSTTYWVNSPIEVAVGSWSSLESM